jgi:hypothetical protein
MSTLKVFYSASDNDHLPAKSNLFADPLFNNPNLFDFSLAANSDCLAKASDGNMGAELMPFVKVNQVFMSAIAYKSASNPEINEFIEITNPGDKEIDISGYKFTKGITFQFPETTFIKAGEKIYVVYNANDNFWINSALKVYQWESGRLADEGEAIQLENPYGIIMDKVFYNADESWPDIAENEGLTLAAENLDNHFGKNWKQSQLKTIVNTEEEIIADSELRFYPNPSSGIINVSGLETKETLINIYNLTGVLVQSEWINSNHSQINLLGFEPGIYVIHCNGEAHRIVLL